MNAWKEKSLEIREKSDNLCALCREQGIYNYFDLEVHHIEKLEERPELLLDDYNLICLCAEHHHQADRGEINKEHLKALAAAREERSPLYV